MLRRVLIAIVLAVSTIPLPPMALVGDAACGLPGAPTATVYLPNITKTLGGPAGWVTPFIVQNVGTAPTTLEVSFYDFASGALVTCMTASGLAPQTSFSHIPNVNADLPHGSAFSVVVRSFGSDIVAVVNEHQSEGARQEALSYVGLSSGATTVGLPWVARQDGGWLTTFIVQNLGTAPATATAAFANEDGTRTAMLSRTIQPGRSWAVNPANEPSLLDGTSYAVVLTSDQPVGVVANAHNDAPSASQPMAFSYNGAPLVAGDTHVPWVARNESGRTTTVVVQNLGTASAAPQLTLRRIGAAGQMTIPLAPIPPGRSLRYQLPTIASCPASGTATCPAEGEHALTVSGGSFAVLAYALGGGSVMGGTGTTGASSRVYLPNITRTLGGTPGWTTPIVIQSAGATTAMLRWYRFADGQLAITQYVGGLMSGASVNLDPRSVAELSDNTQYGVVVDGNGPVRATVLELSALGGDGAMAYEGFAGAAGATSIPTVTSIALTPATSNVVLGETVQLVATVRDQSSNTVTGVPLAWTVEPASLGTITNTGAFTAGTTAGTGTARVTGLGLTATVALSVVAQTQTIGSQTFRVVRTASTDVYVEQTITTAGADSIIAVIEPSVAYVQGHFARTFVERPAIYVFPNEASLIAGYYAALGGVGSPLTGVSGVFIPQSRRIGLDWESIELAIPYSTLRHELVHQMEYQITRRTVSQVPVWFVEGLAAMHDLTEPGSGWAAMTTRYWTASNANAGRLFATTLTREQFRALNQLDSNVAYAESAETVRLMYEELGTSGILQMLEQIGTGLTLASAYETRAGRSLTAFLAERDARFRSLAASYPGLVTTSDTPEGEGLAYLGYGFPTNTAVTVTITGAGYIPTVVTRTTDAYGLVWSYLDERWRVGTYTFTITAGAVTVTMSAVKASAVSGLSLSPAADEDVAPPEPQLPEWRPR